MMRRHCVHPGNGNNKTIRQAKETAEKLLRHVVSPLRIALFSPFKRANLPLSANKERKKKRKSNKERMNMNKKEKKIE